MNDQTKTKDDLIRELRELRKENELLKSSLDKYNTESQEVEALLQTIFEKTPQSIQIVDTEGFTIKVNPAFTSLFCATPPQDFSIFADLQSKDKDLERLILRAKTGEVVHLPDTFYNAHDSLPELPDVPVWIRAVIFPLKDNNGKPERFVLMHENITERKQANEILKTSQLLLLSSIESQKDTFFFSIDRNYDYLLFNKVHSDLMKLAYDKDIKAGINFLECINSAEERKAAKEDYDRVFHGESFSKVRVFGDEEPVFYEGFFNPIINDKNEIFGATTLGRNITGLNSRK